MDTSPPFQPYFWFDIIIFLRRFCQTIEKISEGNPNIKESLSKTDRYPV